MGLLTRGLTVTRLGLVSYTEAWALQNIAWAAFSRGDNDLAEERLHASAELFEQIGDYGGRAWAIGLLGYVWYFKGRLNEAGVVAENSIRLSHELGDRWAFGMMMNLLAGVRLWQGQTREARDRSREALRLFEAMDDPMGLPFATVTNSTALVMTGDPEAVEPADTELTKEALEEDRDEIDLEAFLSMAPGDHSLD